MPARCPKHLRDEVAKLSWKMDRWQIAKKLGKSPGTIGNWFTDLRKEGYSVGFPPAVPLITDDVIELTGNAVVIGDVEVPDFSPAVFVKAMEVASLLGITCLVLNGDIFALDQLATWLPDRPAKRTFAEDLASGDQVIDECFTTFDELVINTGNHDCRLAWKTGGQTRLAQFYRKRAPKLRVSDHWYCKLHSGGRDWIIGHQSVSGSTQNPLLEAARWGAKYQANIIVNHPHYLWSGWDISDTYQVISAGCARDEDRTGYKAYRLDGKPRWNQGFAYIYDGWGYTQHVRQPLPSLPRHRGK